MLNYRNICNIYKFIYFHKLSSISVFQLCRKENIVNLGLQCAGDGILSFLTHWFCDFWFTFIDGF